MAVMAQKLKVYKSANNTTYTADIYTTPAEALNSPIRVQIGNTVGYVAASTKPPADVAIPLYVQKGGVTYQAMTSGYKSGSITFTSNGTFTVPVGVSTIYVTASAGGGGGGGGANEYFGGWGSKGQFYTGSNGGAGGNTSLGNLLTLQGGGGGVGGTFKVKTQDGKSYSTTVVNSNYGGGGKGGSSAFPNAPQEESLKGNGGAGGRGANCSNKAIKVSQGQVLSVVIGKGGAAGAAAGGSYSEYIAWNSEAGQQGYMYIRW